jgi:O-methyltransferase
LRVRDAIHSLRRRSGPLYERWDALPRPRELRDLGGYRTGRSLHRSLWDEGYTMLSSRRARTLRDLARRVHDEGIPGALVDCGAWNGGSSILLAVGAPDRPVWVFDSFQGLPDPGALDGPESAGFGGDCVGSADKVRAGFAQYGATERLRLRPGWFEDTLAPAAPEVGEVALLHCDGDWYDSVRHTLEVFYPRVPPGGFVVIDDYGTWPGARRAADELRERVGDRAPLHKVDHTAVWWRKPAGTHDAAAAPAPQGARRARTRVQDAATDHELLGDRAWTAESTTIPWLEAITPLAGKRIVEYGCGSGIVSRAFARHAAHVHGIDILDDAIAEGRRENERLGVENVTLEAHPVPEIVDALRAQAGQVDLVLLYAVVEHLTIAERLEVLRAAREVARPHGLIVVVEAPNRLVSFDHHSSMLPYGSWLPFDLLRRYGTRAYRPDFLAGLREIEGAGAADQLEWWHRYGAGVSFHEFELAFGDLSRHVVAGGYDTVMYPARPLLPPEPPLARDLARQRPDLGPMWSRSWLDLVLTPDPTDAPRRFVWPWTMDTGESSGLSYTRWDSIAMPDSNARLRARPAAPTERVIVGLATPPGEVVLTVLADGELVAEVPTGPSAASGGRYVDVRWDGPAELVELRVSPSAHVSLVAFEH